MKLNKTEKTFLLEILKTIRDYEELYIPHNKYKTKEYELIDKLITKLSK